MSTENAREELAERHAQDAEHLLANKFGWIDSTLKAQVHATLAVYYAIEAGRRETAVHDGG
jgi:hypothetical protein